MPKQLFALVPGGPKCISVSWSGLWKNLQVSFDGAPVGGFATKQEVEIGRSFALPDGSQLHVRLANAGVGVELQLMRNNVALPGSTSEPAQRVAAAAGVLFFVGALNAVLGVLAQVAQITFLLDIGLGFGSVVMGAFYAGLGYLVKAKRSRIALVIAIVLFTLDGIASVFMGSHAGGSPPAGSLIGRFFFLVPMWKGVAALTELKKNPAG